MKKFRQKSFIAPLVPLAARALPALAKAGGGSAIMGALNVGQAGLGVAGQVQAMNQQKQQNQQDNQQKSFAVPAKNNTGNKFVGYLRDNGGGMAGIGALNVASNYLNTAAIPLQMIQANKQAKMADKQQREAAKAAEIQQKRELRQRDIENKRLSKSLDKLSKSSFG